MTVAHLCLSLKEVFLRATYLAQFFFLVFINDLCNSSQFLRLCTYAVNTVLLCASNIIHEFIGKVSIEFVILIVVELLIN